MENYATGQVLPYRLLCLTLCLACGGEARAAEETIVVRAEDGREKFRRLAPDYSQEKRKLERIALFARLNTRTVSMPSSLAVRTTSDLTSSLRSSFR